MRGLGAVPKPIGKVVFAGECFAVTVDERNSADGDDHLMFHIWVEDDENWFCKLSASSFWLKELLSNLGAAELWMSAHAVQGQWGYSMTPGENK